MYRGISDFEKGYKPRTHILQDEKGNFFADSHNILARWRNRFFQLMNVHGVNDIRPTEIHTTEPLVPEPSFSEIDLAIENI